MMKLALFVFLAVLAYASAGLIALGPSTYSAEGVSQVHHPWAVSSSSRVQTFNDAAVIASVPVAHVAAPIAHVAAAPIAHVAAAPVAHLAAAPLSPLVYY